MIKVKNLKISTAAECILQPVSFSWSKGDHILLFGANGSGKTTFIETLIGLDRKELKISGDIKLDSNHIGYLPQKIEYPLNFPITVSELWDLTISNFSIKKYKEKARESLSRYLTKFKINQIVDKKIGDLSGGQLQKVRVVQAFLGYPDILILDEPTNNLDQDSIMVLKDLINYRINQKDGIVIQISHDHNLDDIYPNAKKLEIYNNKLQTHVH